MYLLDTHILIWWLTNPEQLAPGHLKIIRSLVAAASPVGVSPASFVEIGRLALRKRIAAPQPVGPWLERIERDPRIQVYPLTARVAMDAVSLPDSFPKDPSDRIIAGTARVNGLVLITVDKSIRNSGVVQVL